MTYNILDDAVGREALVLEVLQATQPDIVVLQEVGRAETALQWAEALGMEACFAAGNSKRHLALLSRLPIVQHHSYHPVPLSTTLLEATLEIAPGQHLRVHGVHLIAQPFVLLEMWRWWEIKIILRRIKAHMIEPCLLAGDFNAIGPGDPVNISEWPRHLKLMLAWYGGRVPRWAISEVKAAGFMDCFRSFHPHEDGFTLPTPAPNSRLDYLFVNEALRRQLAECRVVREPPAVEQASDHYPVMASFLGKKPL
jgi:endonuclease/exonuclease/phosphatase family metal-dependent hydrolase